MRPYILHWATQLPHPRYHGGGSPRYHATSGECVPSYDTIFGLSPAARVVCTLRVVCKSYECMCLYFRISCLSVSNYYIEINCYLNAILLSQFSHISMHTYSRQHNIYNHTVACDAFKLASHLFQIITVYISI